MMFLDARDGLGRFLVGEHFGFRAQTHLAGTVRAIHDRSFVSNHYRARFDFVLVLFQFRWTGNALSAAVPIKGDRPTLPFGRELVRDDFSLRKRVALRLEIVILDLRL